MNGVAPCKCHKGLWMWVVLSLTTFFAGCGGGRSPADNRAFLLEIEPQAEARGVVLRMPLRIHTCRVAAPFAGRPLVYRLTGVQYQYDPYNAFLVPLSDQLDDSLYRWLDAGPGPADRASYTLDPYLETLLADFTDPNRPMASARMRFTVTRAEPNDSLPSVVYRKTLAAQIGMQPKPSADQVVAALSVCVQHILGQLKADLASVPLPDTAKE